MSGRDKRAPADPAAEREQMQQLTRKLHEAAQHAAAEREQMRQLTRELHEAAQHAADERKALLKAQTDIATGAAELAQQIVDEQHQALAGYFDTQWARLQEIITNTEVKIREGFTAEMAAAGVTDVVIRTCGMILHLSDSALSIDEWVNSLKDIAAMHTVTGCTCLGCMAIQMARTGTLKTPRSARRPPGVARPAGEIMVATPEGLAAYTAAGGRAPDLIIDAR